MNQESPLISYLQQNFGIDLDALVRDIKRYMPDLSEQKFRKAFYFAADAHDGQERYDKSPYIIHPVEIVKILTSLQVDQDTLIAAFLHDVPEDTSHKISEIEAKFGKRVAFLVDGVTKLSKVHYKHDMAKRQIESLKKLFIHSAEDPRIILIKLADRLHNMRTLQFVQKEEKRIRIARETFEIFVPIANMLGIEEIKSELEELSFRFLFPDEYESLADRVNRNKQKNQLIQDKSVQMVEEEFKKNNILATVYGRQRNLYTIYKKIVCQEKRLDDFDNTLTLRILVQDKDECYKALGIIHSMFKPKPGKFKDYIAVPKINGYQSLHTTVFGINGINTEFQIRSNLMHLEAEYGITAHYFQNDNKNKRQVIEADKRAYWAAKILKMNTHQQLDDDDFIEGLKVDIFRDRIFVFTPRGDAIDLPQDATCIDFAYNIHTEVGNCALKADINGKLVPMTTILQNGDTIKIITSDLPKGPNRSWLAFAQTNVAKNRIRDYFKRTSNETKLSTGRTLLQKEFDRAGLGMVKDLQPRLINMFCSKYNQYKNFEDILLAIGEGTLATLDFINTIYSNKTGAKFSHLKVWENPIADNDEIKPVTIRIVAKNTVGLMQRISKVIAEHNINIIKADGRTSPWTGDFVCKVIVGVSNYVQVSKLFVSLEQIEGLKSVERLFWQRKLAFIVGSSLTFAIWAAHPFILHYINNDLANSVDPFFAEALHYIGIFMLFMMVFSLKSLTQRSFPELRETNTFWVLTFTVSAFALITLLAEIYFFKLNFPWVILFGLILMVFAYLTAEYINYRDRI